MGAGLRRVLSAGRIPGPAGRRGAGGGAARLTLARGQALIGCPGRDDSSGAPWLAGGAAAQSFQALSASVPPAGGREAEETVRWREPAAAFPIGERGAASLVPRGGAASRRPGQHAVSAPSPSSARMWTAWRTILRASDSAARFPSILSLTCA